MAPKLTIARQHYDCILCGRCCRRFFVPMTVAERERIAKLMHRDDFTEKHGSAECFRRGEDGSCVFQNQKGLCEIHRLHGFDVKALVCRGYPFSLMPTFPGEASVLARMDCPAVAQEHGRVLSDYAPQLTRLLEELHPRGGGFTSAQLAQMDKASIQTLLKQFTRILDDTQTPMQVTMGLLMEFLKRCRQLGGLFLSDPEVSSTVYPSMLQSCRQDLPDLPKAEGTKLDSVILRRWLAAFLRRDEETPRHTFATRMKAAWRSLLFSLGKASLRSFSQEHPDISLKKATSICRPTAQGPLPASVWESYRRFLHVHLETFQFFGGAYYGCDLFEGLCALFLTFLPARLLACAHAAAEERSSLQSEDVQYAVMAIDHAFGRTPELRSKSWRSREATLAEHFSSLILLDKP